MTKGDSILINLSLSVLSLAFRGLAIEIAVRGFGYSAPVCRRVDPVLGWALAPGCEGFVRVERSNYFRVNAQGRNDDSVPLRKGRGVLRIAFVGDSFTQAAEVPRSKNYVTLVRDRLGASLSGRFTKVEALNFGVEGYGTGQEYLQLQREVLKYSPDVVVLLMFLGNDISDNAVELTESLGELRPYFALQGGVLTRVPGYPRAAYMRRDELSIRLVDHLRSLQFLKEAWMGRVRVFGRPPKSERIPGRIDGVFRRPDTPEWQRAWSITEALVDAFAARVKASNAQFLLVTAPEPIRVDPDPRVRAAFLKRLGADSLDYPDERVREVAEHGGLPLLELAVPLSARAEHGAVYLHGFDKSNYGDGHWNEDGHRAVAELISTALVALIQGKGRTAEQLRGSLPNAEHGPDATRATKAHGVLG